MCGIVGFVANQPDEKTLNSMINSQTHRGPDDNGLYIDEKTGVHLGHNRLSIQDTSSHAHQPFISSCHNYTIIFNGEVYNFQTIKKELETKGYDFISNSDTEVILYAYKEWGIKCIDRFIGMFAFVIHDIPANQLFLVRDRAGVKPLYYYVKNEIFIFSSELKSFHESSHFSKTINREFLPFYFQFGYIPAPYTIYEDCFKLRPGHYMVYDLSSKQEQTHKYWDIHDFYLMDKFKKSEERIVQGLEELLIDSCKLRLISDVPVGLFLSGGYDSSSVTSLLQNNQTHKLNTFTIGFNDKELNEADDAQKIAALLGTKHREKYATKKELLDLTETLPYYYDEPFADDSALPTMLVSKVAREEVTVALSADGGDELFFGYSKYFALQKILKLQSSPFKYQLFKAATKLLNESTVTFFNALLPKSKRQANLGTKFQKFKHMLNANGTQEMFINASSKVPSSFLEKVLEDGKFQNFHKTSFRDFKKLESIDSIDQMMAIDYKTFMVDDVLCKVDRATMAFSLEGREPLLDHRLAEYMAQVPASLKYKNTKGKYLLREILKKYIPTEITDKPKAGFTVPIKSWLQNELKELMLEALKSDILQEDKIFKEKELTKITHNFKNGKIENPTFLWMILMYVSWRNRWK
jgi:asparagine synthase (glutamine-hydrolysing)